MVAERHDREDFLRQTITKCLDLDNPKSFFLYAGAGSGKTKAVVDALDIFRELYGSRFRQSGQKVAVITYTNAACDEIKRRIDFDPIFAVSTIHSFAWEQIRSYHKDIRASLQVRLSDEIAELHVKQKKGKPGTKAAADREVQIESKKDRLQNLDVITRFTYNPNGENIGKDSLNHAEVIAISAAFLKDKQLMRQVLIGKYPVVLIDESQDTQKDLIDAFFTVQKERPDGFCLALFGDTMQRIYADGKVGLEKFVPADWEKPAISVNYRCPQRVVSLLNQIRLEVDGVQQEPRQDAEEGVVRLFLIDDSTDMDKQEIESTVAIKMAEVSSDDKWRNDDENKVLTIEHHMAARRAGFDSFFEPLYAIDNFKTGLLDGTLPGIPFFVQEVLPLIQALKSENNFAVTRIVKDRSPILSPERLIGNTEPLNEVHKARRAVASVFLLWDDAEDPVLLDVLRAINRESLLGIPEVFAPILSNVALEGERRDTDSLDDKQDGNPAIDAWRRALTVPFSQLEAYADYISDKSPFGTHQGIKGLEFPRVMVILDDNEARGFMFNYEKLLGAKALTATDEKNRLEGKETSVDRTRRLFYVTCSRARQSLAVVVYTKEADKVSNRVSESGWFERQEIVLM